jgi:hypothetical protein
MGWWGKAKVTLALGMHGEKRADRFNHALSRDGGSFIDRAAV